MTPVKLLKLLHSKGIQIWVEGDRLRYRASKGSLTDDLRREMRENKSELLELLRPNAASEAGSSSVINRVARRDEMQLSFAQERIWFLDQFQPGSATYNIPVGLEIDGDLDVKALQDSVFILHQQHEILRTTFPARDGVPCVVISPDPNVSFEYQDLRELTADRRETQARQIAMEVIAQPFDLASGPLFRTVLLKLTQECHWLLISIHHIIFDGWSFDVLLKDLSRLYECHQRGNEPGLDGTALQYIDFAQWQREHLQGETLEHEMDFWRRELQGDLPILQLPTDRPRPPVKRYRGGVVGQTFSVETMQSLRALSKDAETTLFMTLLAAYVVLLRRYTGQRDLIVGTPIAGRERAETHDMIGLFVNTLVLRFEVDGSQSFLDVLQHIKEVSLNAFEHQDVPFEKLVDELQPSRNLDGTPFFSTMFTFHQSAQASTSFEGLTLSRIPLTTQTSKFDFTLSFFESEDGLGVAAEYDSDLFEEETVSRFLSHLRVLLHAIGESPNCAIEQLPLISEDERRQLLVELNSTQLSFPSNKCIHQLVEEQVQRSPDAIAVVSEGQQLSYCELNERSNQVAHRLLELGVGPDSLVGICTGRSANLLVGILGILKAGGAYVPLDIHHPAQRRRYILDNADVELLVTESGLLDQLDVDERTSVCVDAGQSDIARQSNCNPETACSPKHLAYVMYTSGSTGQPKGVAIEHRSVVNLLMAMRAEIGITAEDRWLSVTTPTFDISVLEYFLPLAIGAEVELVGSEAALDAKTLSDHLEDGCVTVMQATPATWQMLLANGWRGSNRLKVLCGGEAMGETLASALHERSSDAWNVYGPTETTIWSTSHRLTSGALGGSIGRPLGNNQVYVLDGQRQTVPIGVAGELYIGGCGLARGYLNQPELTADKFIDHPFSDEPGSRLYRTGDLVRWRPDGTLDFIGRLDTQVKLRGFRIELGEIESALQDHSRIREAVVMLRQDTPSDPQLVAYLVLDPEDSQAGELDLESLRNHLNRQLPNYMIPSAFVILDVFPKNPNGKLDRKQLPRPTEENYSREVYQAPRNELEAKLVQIWQELLQLEKPPSIHDNFFLIGGHSLLAVGVVSKIEKEVGRRLPISVLFERPTISGIAERLAENRNKQKVADAISMSPDGEGLPLFILPGIVGDVVVSSEIISGLACPIIGLQPNVERDDFELFRDLRETARHFADLILKHQPIGPYSLFGFSFGGYLAHEVAIELTNRGEDVECLLILDSGPGYRDQNRPLARSVLRWARITLNLPLWLASELARFEVDRWARRTTGIIKRLLPGSLRNRFPTDPVLEIWDLENLSDQPKQLLYANHHALCHYQPQFYSGTIHLIRARVRSLLNGGPSDMGWSSFASEVEVYTISGDHESIIRKPRVRSVVNIMNDLLRFRASNEFSDIHDRPGSQKNPRNIRMSQV